MSRSRPKSDAWLDAELRNVPLPAGLLARLEEVAELSDEELDAALCDVPVPASLAKRLQRIGQQQARLARLYHLAMAVSVLLAIGLGYFGLTVSFLADVRPPLRSSPKLLAQWEFGLPEEAEPRAPDDLGAWLDTEKWSQRHPSPGAPAPDFVLPPMEQWASGKPAGVGITLPENLDLDVNRARWPVPDVRAIYNGRDDLEDPKKVPGLKPRGIDVPLVLGYDVPFLSKTGFHPFVCPAVNPQLRSVAAPLASDTESYDLARRYLEDGELPPRSELRTEEFLAAIDYDYPRPSRDALGLFVAGGPSPFHGHNLQMLQLGVQARPLPPGNRLPVRLTLVVDTSGSMNWGGRLEMVRQALDRHLNRMGPKDRISLVAFGDDSYPLVEDATRGQREQLRAAVALLQADGMTNVTAGLRCAYVLALGGAPAPDEANRVVLLTDGLARPDAATTARINQRLAEAVDRGSRLHIVDLSQEREADEPDPFLNDLAWQGGGRVYRATSVEQIGWALEEVLTGRSPLVASDVQLRITFNLKAVEVYRLLGHEPRTVVALKPAQPQSDFYAGQSGTVLYELRLLPKGADDVALAELTWRDPQNGQIRRTSQPIRRSQFVAQWHQAAMPLQAAAMVAEAAEQLRGSLPLFNPAWPNPGSLEPVRQVSRQVDSRLLARPTYAAFLELLEQAAKARPYRSGGDPRTRPWRENSK